MHCVSCFYIKTFVEVAIYVFFFKELDCLPSITSDLGTKSGNYQLLYAHFLTYLLLPALVTLHHKCPSNFVSLCFLLIPLIPMAYEPRSCNRAVKRIAL